MLDLECDDNTFKRFPAFACAFSMCILFELGLKFNLVCASEFTTLVLRCRLETDDRTDAHLLLSVELCSNSPLPRQNFRRCRFVRSERDVHRQRERNRSTNAIFAISRVRKRRRQSLFHSVLFFNPIIMPPHPPGGPGFGGPGPGGPLGPLFAVL